MSDWLELELAHHLAPVEAPPSLTWRAPEAAPPRPRWSFTLAPIVGLAAAIAVLILAAFPGRTTAGAVNRYLAREAGFQLPIPGSTRAQLERARIVKRGGARIAAITYRLNGTESTVLIARAGTIRGAAWQAHGTYAIAGSCVLCHANL